MPDIRTIWDPVNIRGDWRLAARALQDGGDLETAVILSVMTDARAAPDDVIPDGSGDPRGWWADTTDFQIGSKVWLRQRSKATDDTLGVVKDDIDRALKWMVDDGVAARVDVLTEWTAPSMLGALVTVWRQDATSQSVQFSWAWETL